MNKRIVRLNSKIKNESFYFFPSFWASQNVIDGKILFAHINTPHVQTYASTVPREINVRNGPD
jgi:hypothetical protein